MHTHHHKPQIARWLPSEPDTVAFGEKLGRGLAPGLIIYLTGDLGSGKTTLARGVLRGLGFHGRVKSPSFTLVEVYEFSKLYLYHFDFYRFDEPQELTDAGFREYFRNDSACLIEWPEKARGLPPADVRVLLRRAQGGRSVQINADTEAGRLCIQGLEGSGTD